MEQNNNKKKNRVLILLLIAITVIVVLQIITDVPTKRELNDDSWYFLGVQITAIILGIVGIFISFRDIKKAKKPKQ